MRRHHWFLFVSQGVLILFLGVMVYVLAVAYTRRSGSAGLDMAAMQKIRYDQQQQASAWIP